METLANSTDSDITNVSSSWLFDYQKLSEFVQENKRFPTVVDSISLVQWILIQQLAIKNSLLFTPQKIMIENIPGWSTYPDKNTFRNDITWLNMFTKTKEYLGKNNHKLSDRNLRYKGLGIGRWYDNQKAKIKHSKTPEWKKECFKQLL